MDAQSRTKPRTETRLLARGESFIASTGLALAAILMLSLAAAGGWAVYMQRQEARDGAMTRLEMCGTILAQTLDAKLAAGDDGEARKFLVTAARENGLSRCRIVLADGTSFVDADEKLIIRKAAVEWPPGEPPPMRGALAHNQCALGVALNVPGRGQARLELALPVKYPQWAGWQAQSGIGAIGAAGFGALLLVYRRLRSRVGGIGAIREALLMLAKGETSGTALMVNPRLGPEAVAWNALIKDCDRLRADVMGGKARETLGKRGDGRNDLAGACDALWQGLLIADEQLKIKYVNGAAAIFLKGKREDLVGAGLPDSLKDAALLDAIKSVAAGMVRRKSTIELKRSEAEGGGVLRFGIRPVRREDGGAAVVIIEDVTQQKVADEARNAFIAQATHELRTPLTNIRLYVERAIEAREDEVQKRAQCLNVINDESRRLERIVGDMLSVSEIEAGTFRLRTDDVRLETLFEELKTDFVAVASEKGVTLTFDLPPKLPVIRGDRDKIVLAVHNLVGNALKYTPQGGQVTVKVAENAGGGIGVEVIDTGIGISQEEQELIFERFYRAKDTRINDITGTGLGLALAREVARLHGGDIAVKSQLNKGSTFAFTLPARAEAA